MRPCIGQGMVTVFYYLELKRQRFKMRGIKIALYMFGGCVTQQSIVEKVQKI